MTAGSLFLLLVRKELALEARNRELFSTMAIFSFLMVVLFSFAFYTDAERAAVYAPGILWITVLFSGTLGLNRLYDKELEGGALDVLLMGAQSSRVVFVAKALTHFFLTLGVVFLTVPVLMLFFRLQVSDPIALLFSLTAGTLGFSFLGTLFASALCYARMRDVLLPMVLYPLVVPVLIAGVKSTGGILQNLHSDVATSWTQFMIGYDLLFVTASVYIYKPLSEQLA